MAHGAFPILHPITSNAQPYTPLTDEEIQQFVKELDKDNNGFIDFQELESKLEDVHAEIAPQPRKHNLHHPDRKRKGPQKKHQDLEQGEKEVYHEHDGIHAFLSKLMPDCEASIPKDDFIKHVRAWNVPSLEKNAAEDEDQHAKEYAKGLSRWRHVKALWSIYGPKVVFMSLVIGLQLAFGLWQLMTYVNKRDARTAFGWGVIVAKGAAGVLYPTLFFMILSMSRWFATFCRRFYYISRIVDWDRHQSFHIWMALVGLFFATLHAIGHLTGTFLYGSRPAQQDALAIVLGPDAVPRPYSVFASSLPGWSGMVSLGLFWTITLLSEPHVRKWSYELFQGGHLLMFPMIGLLCTHGTAKLLQFPMLGFWLVVPGLLVIGERAHRLYRGLRRIPATVKLLDEDTVAFTCRKPGGGDWRYSAGQYIFLQVPSVSFFQWHPFTISACRGNTLQLHVKSDGDWTEKLRELPTDCEVFVGLDGPFGAPAQRFYEYDRALIIGSGVGVTPFSAILTDLVEDIETGKDPWAPNESPRSSVDSDSNRQASRRASLRSSIPGSSRIEKESDSDKAEPKTESASERRVDFHWMVREKNNLLWFSDLLNRAHDLSQKIPRDKLDLRIKTHITMKRKKISTHIFRYLLDAYRTPTVPVSALTGLRTRSEFGRPDFEDILGDFHSDVAKEIEEGKVEKGDKVAVFFCGSPIIGEVLSDVCQQLTLRGRTDGSDIRWDFRMEVFG